jgi:hypothetical protein
MYITSYILLIGLNLLHANTYMQTGVLFVKEKQKKTNPELGTLLCNNNIEKVLKNKNETMNTSRNIHILTHTHAHNNQ